MLDVGRLRVFREVATRRSFSAAADALDYTQSAVSQRISTLERDVGLALIDRGSRPIRLTEAGEILLARTELIFGEVAAAESDLRALAGLEAGRCASAGSRPPARRSSRARSGASPSGIPVWPCG